ncbi:hypothetical protein AC1031_014822 [Aphanomyces cochlioides]|nr:hypothetical protein AC1031_014822 [Aphanomyces cochlioides]
MSVPSKSLVDFANETRSQVAKASESSTAEPVGSQSTAAVNANVIPSKPSSKSNATGDSTTTAAVLLAKSTPTETGDQQQPAKKITLADFAKAKDASTKSTTSQETATEKLSLLVVAKAEKAQPTTSATNSTAPSLMSVAQTQKPSLADVASNSNKPASLVEAVNAASKTSKQSLVAVTDSLRKDDKSTFGKETSIAQVAAQVHEEVTKEVDQALKQATKAVQKENDTKASIVLAQAVREQANTTAPRATKPRTSAETVPTTTKTEKKEPVAPKSASPPQSPTYSEEDAESAGKPAVDNQSEDASEDDGPERTTPSTDKQQREFLIAVYRGNMRKVREMLDSGDVDVHATDQVPP